MKKRLMAVLLCVCMAAVLLTPYASVLTADGALRLGVAGADGSLTEGGDDAVLTEGGESGKATDPAPTTVQSAPQEEQPAPQQEQSEPQAEGAPQTEGEAKQPEETKAEQPAQTEKAPESEGEAKQPEETKAEQPAQTEKPAEKPALPKYVWDSEKDVVWKDGSEKLALKDYVVKANWTALAYTDPTDSNAKTYAAGDRVRVYDEIKYEDCDGAERKWSVVLDGSDFYFVLSEALEPAPELPAQAPAQTPAQTDMKSLFGIGDNVDPANIINPDDAKVRTYVFMYKDKEITRQSVKNGDTLKPVEVPVGANERFVGWEPKVTFDTTINDVTETKTITVTAVVEKVYTVYFKTADGKLVLDTKQGARGETISNFETVDLKKYQLAADESVIGWKDGNEEVTSVTIADKDITLTAVIGEGYWITFDSNGGSYVAPAFYLSSEPATAPTNPTKPGYNFDKWYLDAGHTQVADFTKIKESTILYAGWTAKTDVKYTVIYKVENADDDQYSYLTSVEKTGKVGDKTAATELSDFSDFKEDKRGFTVQTITQQTIEGDGSTIVNVLYKRNVYEVTFWTVKEQWKYIGYEYVKDKEIIDKRITAKYGANIRAKWPGGVWNTEPGGDTFQAGIDVMPLGGDEFFETDQGNAKVYYYLEDLKGDYVLDHTDTGEVPPVGFRTRIDILLLALPAIPKKVRKMDLATIGTITERSFTMTGIAIK